MTTCPRCGTGVLPAATVCTTCCQLLTGQALTAAAPVEVTVPETVTGSTPARPDERGPSDARDALHHWPFGGADAETIRTVAQEQPSDSHPQLRQAATVASGGLRGELQLPTQRTSAFNTMHISSTPPPNPYLAAERRLQEHYRTTRATEHAGQA
jgi:hypothetical protein